MREKDNEAACFAAIPTQSDVNKDSAQIPPLVDRRGADCGSFLTTALLYALQILLVSM